MLDETLLKIRTIKSQLEKLDAAHAEKAKSAAGFADAVAHEAARRERSPKLLKIALEGLEHSARDLEAHHPKLAAAIVELCRELSSLGI